MLNTSYVCVCVRFSFSFSQCETNVLITLAHIPTNHIHAAIVFSELKTYAIIHCTEYEHCEQYAW